MHESANQESVMHLYRYTIVPIMALLLLGSSAGIYSPAQSRMQSDRPVVWDRDHYRYRQSLFLSQRIPQGGIVFLGDSLIERCNWNELLQRMDIVNRGVDGDTSEGVLYRLPHILSLRPRSVFILVGGNDLQLGVSVDRASLRFNTIIMEIRKGLPGTRVYVMDCLPTRRRSLNDKIRRYNARIRRYALSRGASCIGLYAHMTGHDGLLKEEYSLDGLHLTDEGYRAWRHLLADSIAHAP